jgi:hypothetical protein
MKFTKTQQQLIDRAAKNIGNVVMVQTGYRTYVKNSYYGSREFDAATKLVEAGILKHEKTDSFRQQARHAYGTDHFSDHLYTLVK